MRRLLLLAFSVLPNVVFSQSNMVSVFTRPVYVYANEADNKINGIGSVYLGYQRSIKKWRNNTALDAGAYFGRQFSPVYYQDSNSFKVYSSKANAQFTIGLALRYRCYTSANKKWNISMGILGELSKLRGTNAYQNLTGDTLNPIKREIDVEPTLLPYQTVKTNYVYWPVLDAYIESGCNYYFAKNFGASLALLYGLKNEAFWLNMGLDYRF